MKNKVRSKSEALWSDLLEIVDQYNHLVKIGKWYSEDVVSFYEIKNRVMEMLYSDPPKGATVDLLLVPYIHRCSDCKEKAEASRALEGAEKSLSVYLSQTPLCESDEEVSEKATIEMIVKYHEKAFSFHMPLSLARDWKINLDELPRKSYTASEEYRREQFLRGKEAMEDLIDGIRCCDSHKSATSNDQVIKAKFNALSRSLTSKHSQIGFRKERI